MDALHIDGTHRFCTVEGVALVSGNGIREWDTNHVSNREKERHPEPH